MLGAIVGDICGSVYEFSNHKSKDCELFRSNAHFTDDTVMTVALAEVAMSGRPVPVVLREYGALYPMAGYGQMFRRWLRDPGMGAYGSFGNGAAMRVSPAAWAARSEEEALDAARIFTLPTHDHPEGLKGARATALAIWLARQGAGKAEIRARVEADSGYDLSRSVDAIRPSYRFNETCQATVPEALACFLEGDDFEDVIRNAISLGGDSDTLAAIAGSVAEAHFGIPAWMEDAALARLDGFLGATVLEFRRRYVVGIEA
jgi:ADP-ribosylglycohydrolase